MELCSAWRKRMEGIIMLTGRGVLTIRVTTKHPTVPEIFVSEHFRHSGVYQRAAFQFWSPCFFKDMRNYCRKIYNVAIYKEFLRRHSRNPEGFAFCFSYNIYILDAALKGITMCHQPSMLPLRRFHPSAFLFLWSVWERRTNLRLK